MDPNANLAELRRLIERLQDDNLNSSIPQAADLDRLYELFTALDEWLSKGGFLPKAWGR